MCILGLGELHLETQRDRPDASVRLLWRPAELRVACDLACLQPASVIMLIRLRSLPAARYCAVLHSARCRQLCSIPSPSPPPPPTPPPPTPAFLSDERIRVDATYNRWLQLVPAAAAGIGIGTYMSVPAVLGPFVCRAQGVVAQAPTDFMMSDLLPVATAMPLVAGLFAAGLASKSEQFGHRRLAWMSSIIYPLGVYGLSAAAINAHSLPAFALSYALLGGFGFFCGYPQLPPFLTSKWFPDRRGLVMSLYMTCFGSGMLVAVPLCQRLLAHFRTPPVRLGSLDDVVLSTGDAGERLALVDGVPREVIVATSRDLIEAGFTSGVSEGVFLLGTGSNGVCEAILGMGGCVFGLMQFAFWGYRLPASGIYTPAAADASTTASTAASTTSTTASTTTANESERSTTAQPKASPAAAAPSPLPAALDINLPAAMQTPNFYLLFAGSVGVCMTGLPFIQLSKFMVNDIFGASMGSNTAAIAATYPALVASANMGGRFIWGPISDRISCLNTTVLFGLSVPAILLGPYATGIVATDPATALTLFKYSALLSVGIFAGMPVLLAPAAADIFGGTHSGEIYRRLWLTVPLANFMGTTLFSKARDAAYTRHATSLADQVDDEAFTAAFGSGKDALPALISNKTVTMPRLLHMLPEGTADPSPYLYNDIFYGIAGCSALALLCNVAAFKLPVRSRTP